jgi:hypothetical protein
MIHEHREPRRSDIERETKELAEKSFTSATLSNTNPTLTDPGENLGLPGEA